MQLQTIRPNLVQAIRAYRVDDLMQAAAIVASFIYHVANRDEKLPRKQLPEPEQLTKP